MKYKQALVIRVFVITSLLLVASCSVLTNNKTIYTSELDLMSLTAKDTLSKKEMNSRNHYFRIKPSKNGGRKIKFILHEKEDKEIRSDSRYKLKIIKANDSIEVFLEFYGYDLNEDQHMHSIGVIDIKNKHRYRLELVLPKPNRILKTNELDSLYGYLETVTIYHPFVDSVLYMAYEEVYSYIGHIYL